MDQIKIGKFIAECRKKKNLTQIQLADKLNITDRAISKWENGKAMPDSGLMLDLCNILEISVTELLSGEVIKMENLETKTNEKLTNLSEENLNLNSVILKTKWLIIICCSILEIISIYTSNIVLFFSIMLFELITVTTIMVNTGYYECQNCHRRHKITFKEIIFARSPFGVMGGIKIYTKCPHCNTKSWHINVYKKDNLSDIDKINEDKLHSIELKYKKRYNKIMLLVAIAAIAIVALTFIMNDLAANPNITWINYS